MKIYRRLEDLPKFEKTVITIGSFDGVHIGHQKILQRIVALAKAENCESIVVTFHPHPRHVFGATDLKIITTPSEKAEWMQDLGVDHLAVVPFDMEFASQSADAYIQDFLVKYFSPKHIVIGYDHRFGKGREGDISYLKNWASHYDYQVEEISKQEVEDIAISSTKIRKKLLAGAIEEAKGWLGHPFRLRGIVVYGQQLGTKMGFPTANIQVKYEYKLVPCEGIYAVWVWHEGKRYGGMLYIGNRPTIDKELAQSIEVNIFDFNQNVYGQQLTLEFVKFLRGDVVFDSIEALRDQLAQDKIDTLAVLEQEKTK